MTEEEIIEMANKANLPYDYVDGGVMWLDKLEQFAELVAQREREICAEFVASWTGPDGKHGCARALRGRSDGE